MIETILLYLCIGLTAGIIAGLLGVGGGLVIVPALVIMFKIKQIPHEIIMHLALGTSLATIIVTSISSIISHNKRNAILWEIYIKTLPGIILGAIAGTIIANYMSTATLRTAFGIFEVAIAINMLIDSKPSPKYSAPSPNILLLSGFLISCTSAMLGIGGGTLAVPLLIFFSVSLPVAVGTASAYGLPIALFSTIGYMIMGWNKVTIPWTAGYVYMPAFIGIVSASVITAPIGARLAHTLPVSVLKKIFAAVLFTIGIKMLI